MSGNRIFDTKVYSMAEKILMAKALRVGLILGAIGVLLNNLLLTKYNQLFVHLAPKGVVNVIGILIIFLVLFVIVFIIAKIDKNRHNHIKNIM